MNEQEFSQKVMIYSGKFYGYSYKILGDKEEAHDIVQDLYIKLWSIRQSLNNINSIEAFATTIIRNLCIDHLKKTKNIAKHKDNYISTNQEENTFHEDLNNDSEYKINLVRQAVKMLPEIQQRVLIMRDFEEKEFEEISMELNLTPENARVVLSRARKKIRELIVMNL